ncbi:hypothetical protein ACROYT_G036700 [Oculina patagonica]
MFSSVGIVFGSLVLGVTMFCGVVGNFVIIWITKRSPRLKAKSHILIANLAVADALQSCNIFFMFITVINEGHWIFGDIICQISAFLTVEFVLASMLSLTTISINRYFKVVNPERYDKLFTYKSVWIIIAFIWILPLTYAIPPLVGWSSYVFNPGKCSCLFQFRMNHSYAYFLVCTITVPALVTICYTYFRIFQAVKFHRNRVWGIHQVRNGIGVDEFKITSTLAVVVLSYIVCYIPATVVNFIEILASDFEIPVWLDFSSFVLIFMSHANNPVIYGLMSKQYRMSLQELLPRELRQLLARNKRAWNRGLVLHHHQRPVLLVATLGFKALENHTESERRNFNVDK